MNTPRPDHAAVPVGGWRDDARHGIKFVIARRKKLLGYTVAAASFLVANSLVHGQAQAICNVVIAAGGWFAVERPGMPAPRD